MRLDWLSVVFDQRPERKEADEQQTIATKLMDEAVRKDMSGEMGQLSRYALSHPTKRCLDEGSCCS